ncbi:MAG TPA: DNA mismatch repair endonuclease MutL [Methanotrichaceae archaeon]|nr:DNA mismatch repair endonuclease MutL [Methanotrichaceae archaeon]
MPKIKLLDEDTVNKIAAGEVIERPASVVKELIENSIDAGATRILIEVDDGGKGLIKVVDDGCGIDPDDLALAFQKHATSKIAGAEDLHRITTLGFRGEALSSIASVARVVEVTTKTRSALTGTYIRLENGRQVEMKEIGCPAGTSIAVRGLFHNVPARLKYLKSAATELSRVLDLVTEMAIINHNVSFDLFTGRRSHFKSNRSQSWDSCLLRVFGLDVLRTMIPIEVESRGVTIKGSAASQLFSRASPDWIYTYVNGRPVNSRALIGALREAYRSLIPSGRNPIAVVSLEIDPGMIDVNVHPTKREIRFLREDEIVEALTGAVSSALRSRELSPTSEPGQVAAYPERPGPGLKIKSKEEQRVLPLDLGTSPAGTASLSLAKGAEELPADQPVEQSAERPMDRPAEKPRFNILGQVLRLYIVAEGEEGLVLVDQHAAAERIRYESLLERYRTRTISQELIEPVNIELSPKEQVLLESWSGMLSEIGFDISHFGGSTYNVRAVPALGYRLERPEAVHDILRDLFFQGKVSPDSTSRDDVLKLLACRGSIKSGHEMSLEEMRTLMKDLYACQNPSTCPHGRPVAAVIDQVQLEKIFQRR